MKAVLGALLCLCSCAAPRPAPELHGGGPSDDLPALMLAAHPPATLPQEEPEPPPKADPYGPGPTFHPLTVRLGAELVFDFTSEIRLESERLGVGTSIDFEDDLDFQDRTQFFRFDTEIRFNRNHAAEFSYYDIRRNSSRSLFEDTWFGETFFPEGLTVETILYTRILKGSYRYTLFAGDNWELGASIGLHGMGLTTGIRASGSGLEEDFRVPLPLPVVGLKGRWEMTPGLSVVGSAELFYIQLQNVGSVDDLEGFLTDLLLSMEYDAFDHVGFGAGLNYFYMSLEVGDDRLRLFADYGYAGVLIYVRTYF